MPDVREAKTHGNPVRKRGLAVEPKHMPLRAVRSLCTKISGFVHKAGNFIQRAVVKREMTVQHRKDVCYVARVLRQQIVDIDDELLKLGRTIGFRLPVIPVTNGKTRYECPRHRNIVVTADDRIKGVDNRVSAGGNRSEAVS